jgi:hypothetical protein
MSTTISKRSIAELEELIEDIQDEIIKLKIEEKRNTKKTREQVIREFDNFGYVVPPDAKFWKVHGADMGPGAYGMEVGSYTHSCHIDTTDLKVLLVVDGTEHYVDSFADLWLSDPV